MSRFVIVVAIGIFFSGCAQKSSPTTRPSASSQTGVLDQLMVREDVVNRARIAEKDAPTDEWREGPESRPGHYNATRSKRESDLAVELLNEVKPKLKQMSARQLLDSIKTYSPTEESTFPGVAYYVYLIGNQMIMKEIQIRPRSELESLRGLGSDQRNIWTGDNGGSSSIGEFIRYGLFDELNTKLD